MDLSKRKQQSPKIIRKRISFDSRRAKSRSRVSSASSSRDSSARDRALHVWRDMQRGTSFSVAARNNGIKVGTARKYLGSALRQDRPGGRIYATKSHRLVTYLQIPGAHGPVEIAAHGSKEATKIARYKAAVNRFLAGDTNALAPWHGKKIAGVELLTDGRTLKGLAQNDLLPYSLYRSLSGGAA
jgi:hypothetical protein